MPKQYRIIYGYIVTDNLRERTCTIYSSDGRCLSTVNDGEVMAEIRKLEADGIG